MSSNRRGSAYVDPAGIGDLSEARGHNFSESTVDIGLLNEYWGAVQRKLKERQVGGDNIVVVTRTRPFNTREKELNTTNCVRVLGKDVGSGQQQVWVVNPLAPEGGPVKFSFDFCFDSFDAHLPSFVDQKTVFDTIGLDLLAKTWSGYNASIFAYGQTGSGKTYSIMGYDSEKGLIPRICETLFFFIANHGQSRGLQVEATYLEIYQEKIIDLLNPTAGHSGPLKPKDRLKLEAKRKKLMVDKGNAANMEEAREILKQLSPAYNGDGKAPKVREDPMRGVVVDNLKRFAVQSYQDCSDLLEEGLTNRTTAATAMNSSSSRSHAVFTLELTSKNGIKLDATAMALAGISPNKKKKAQVTKITLIDLAGSERAKTADTTGDRLREGGAINKSLSVLGLVISLLAKAANRDTAAMAAVMEEEEAMAAAEAASEGVGGSSSPRGSVVGGSGSPGGGGGDSGANSRRSSLASNKAAASAAANGDHGHIPFRDSVLTWILRDSLIGNSKTVMLAAISPAAVNFHETLSTLRFANQAKLIKTKAVLNEDPQERLIRELREEVHRLKTRLAKYEGPGVLQGTFVGEDDDYNANNHTNGGGGGGANNGGGGRGGCGHGGRKVPQEAGYNDYISQMYGDAGAAAAAAGGGGGGGNTPHPHGKGGGGGFEGQQWPDGTHGGSGGGRALMVRQASEGDNDTMSESGSTTMEHLFNSMQMQEGRGGGGGGGGERAVMAERLALEAQEREAATQKQLLFAEERRKRAESNMSDLKARLNHRRKVVRLHRLGRSAEDEERVGATVEEEEAQLEASGGPFLTFLSDDPSMTEQLRVYVAVGQRLRVGTASAKTEQDVKVAGLGITPETAVFTMRPPKKASSSSDDFGGSPQVGYMCVAPASLNAQVRVNGSLLAYKEREGSSSSRSSKKNKKGEPGERVLQVGDRVVLGTCAHVLLVCESESARDLRRSKQSLLEMNGGAGNNNGGGDERLSNYERAIREVVLQRTESQDEYGRRLAGLVMNRLRLPRARAVFAATLVRALRGVSEANEVAVAMGTNKRFRVHCGALVNNDNLYSLRVDDVLPLSKLRVTVQVLINTHEYRTLMSDPSSSSSSSSNNQADGGGVDGGGGSHGWLSGSGGGGGVAAPEAWCSCELDEFLDLVEDLKQTLSSCRAVAESVVTPTTVGSSFENGGGGGCGSGGGGGGGGGGSPSESGGDGGAYGEDATQFGVAAARAGGRGAGAITRAFFMAADADGDGVINRDELVEAASALGLTPSESEMDALFRQYDVESNDELSLGEFDQFVRDQLCARFDECLAKMKNRQKHNELRARAEIGAHLEQHLDALQTQLQLAVRKREFDIALELEGNVTHVQDEVKAYRKQQEILTDSKEMAHAELLRMKEEALHYSADLRRALMDLADSHAALLMALEPLMDGGRGADVEEVEGIAAASFTAARVGEAASQVAHDLQLLVQGNAAEDAANDELAEAAAAALIAGRTISANAKKALEERVARNSSKSINVVNPGGPISPEGMGKRVFGPDDEVLFRDVHHHRNIVSRLVGTARTMSRSEHEEDVGGRAATNNPLTGGLAGADMGGGAGSTGAGSSKSGKEKKARKGGRTAKKKPPAPKQQQQEGP